MRRQIQTRLLMMADFLVRTEGCRDTARLALANALSLGVRDGESLVEIPFVRRLAAESISFCANAIEEGRCPGSDDGGQDWTDEGE